MKHRHSDKISIWPIMEGEADEPTTGRFAVKLGKGHAERVLFVAQEDGKWAIYLDGRLIADRSPDWRQAFGYLHRNRTDLFGRPIDKEEYDRLRNQRVADQIEGTDLSRPINLNRVKAPF